MVDAMVDVSDPTDWLSTPLRCIAAVESALRCQVCKDFYNAPVITACSHTFCSLCVRRALASDGRCPACRAPEQEIRLRPSLALGEAVLAFTEARKTVLDFATNIPQESGATLKRNTDELSGSSQITEEAPERKRVRTSARLAAAERSRPVSYVEVAEQPKDDGLVSCPVCQARMKEILVDRHLDTTCPGLSGGESSKQPESTASPLAERTVTMSDSLRKPPTAPETTVAAARPERLPSINYSMLRDAGLRKKLTELGISAVGPRATLERRHKEWVAIWNANCDSPRPRRRAELLADLYAWERANLGKSGGAGGGGGGTIAVQSGGGFGFGEAAQSTVNIRDKDFDAAAWASKHNDSFKDLIASARRSAARKQGGGGTDEAPPEAPKNEGEGGEPTVSDQGASSPARREASDSEPLQDSKSTIRLEDER